MHSRRWVTVLLLIVVAEGILGAQVREMTDELAKGHGDLPQDLSRASWIGQLESSAVYLSHRSGSWLILLLASFCWWHSRQNRVGKQHWAEHGVLAIVWLQMVLGLIMAQIHVYSWVQVLHVGLAAVLLSLLWLWRFGLSQPRSAPNP